MQATYRRNNELWLLLLALIVGGGALALVALSRSVARVSLTTPLIAIVAASYIAAHLFVRRVASQADRLVLPLAAVLNTLGIAAVYRLSAPFVGDSDAGEYGATQVTWTMVGIAAFAVTLLLVRDHRALARYKYLLGFAGVGLLLLPMTPLGMEINGARLWVGIGTFSFQPGELAKICLVVFFAAYLAERKELLAIAPHRVLGIPVPDVKHFGPLLLMWGLSLAVMFFEKDLGSSLLFFSIFVVMIYVATARAIYLILGTTLFAAGAYVGYHLFGHVQDRVAVWLNVFDDRLIQDEGYQLAQSLFALATGGLFGTGLGRGRPDLVPEAHTDFVFSVIGEELGLLGTAAVLLAFLLLVARGLRIALAERTDFGQLLAAGLMATFGIQTVIILGGVTRLLPLTGITLPFMSYGGSSLLSNFVLIALLVRISHQSTSEPEPAQTGEILIGGRH